MRKGTWAGIVVAMLTGLVASGAGHAASGTTGAKAVMARLPLAFEPSVDGRAFLSHTGSAWTRVSPSGFEIQAGRSQDAAIRMELVGAAGHAAMQAQEPGGEVSYLLGTDTLHWRQHVPQYGRVVSRDVYRDIDLVFYGRQGHLEHDFVVGPLADYRAIRMRYTGQVSMTADGELRISRGSGQMVVHEPVAYQNISGRRVSRESHFVLTRDEVSFAVGDYDHSLPLVIDPVLDYGTFLADQDLHVAAMAVDNAGNTYITGLSFSGTYPVTAGASQTTCVSCPSEPDVFVTKLNAAGTAQVYSTFLGGNDYDESFAIAVDGSGNAIISGRTQSTDFPVKNPINSGQPGAYAGFAASLTPDGAELNFSTILGGTDAPSRGVGTYIGAVATDSDGNAYFGGLSDATTVPVTPGALDAVTPGYPLEYSFLTKLSKAGALLYGAILGQVDPTSGCCSLAKVTVNAQGEVLIAGSIGSDMSTGAVHWPTTPGAYQTAALQPGAATPIVAKLAADASHLVFSTLAGAGVVRDAVVDASGATILLGDTASPVPVTADAYFPQSAGGFLEKVSADGQQLLYASYLGNPSQSRIADLTTQSIALDGNGDVWVAGRSEGSIPVVHPLQALSAGPSGTGFISEFDPAMHTLLFSTYFSANQGLSIPAGIGFDGSGKLHLVGTGPSDMPTTSGALRTSVTPPPPGYTYNYGYVAVIDPAVANPGLCIGGDPTPAAELGTTSQDSFLLTNCGLAPLTISGTQLSGLGLSLPQPAVCDATIAPGDSCSLPWVFTPQVAPQTASVLTIDSNAMVKETVLPVNAVGFVISGLALNVQPQSAVFGPQQVGTTSVQQTLDVYNTSTFGSQVTISSIATTGDFSQTNTCAGGGGPFTQCQVQVSFTPTASGAHNGVLMIASNALGSPIQIPLTGQGLAVLLATPQTPSLTVTSAGQSATTAIQIQSQNGFAGTATLTCSVQFQGQGTAHDLPTCSLDPAQVQVSANGAASTTLVVKTTVASSAAVRHAGLYWLAGVLLACLLPARRSLRAMSLALVLGCTVVGALTGCGGGGSSSPAPVTTPPAPTDAGTTKGTYLVTVTATSGTASTTAQVSVVVQ